MKNLNYSNQTQCNLKQFQTISCCESAWWMFHSIIQLRFHLHPSSAFVSSSHPCRPTHNESLAQVQAAFPLWPGHPPQQALCGLYGIHSMLWLREDAQVQEVPYDPLPQWAQGPCESSCFLGCLWAAQPGSHTGLWPAVLVRMCGRLLRLSFFTSREPWNSGEVLRWIPQVLAEQTCKGMWMMGEPVFKGDGWLILDKDKSYALDATLGFTDQKTEREKGRSNRGVKYTSPIKISTRWYLLISWKLEGTSAQPGPGSSSHSCHHFFLLAS